MVGLAERRQHHRWDLTSAPILCSTALSASIGEPYTLFDAGPNGTQPRAIGNSGKITGLLNANAEDPVNSGAMF